MSNTRESKIRQLLLREFRANHTVDQAYKTLRFIFGPLLITRDAVSHWFKNFENGQTKIFADNFNEANLNLVPDEMFEKNSKAMLVHFNKGRKGRNTTTDGRMHYSIGYDQKNHQQTFVITDLFHGKTKSVFFPDFSSGCLEIVDYERFLLFDSTSLRLFLLKLNNANWTIEVLHSVAFEPGTLFDFFILDQQNSRKFILIGDTIIRGEIQGDQIVLEATQHDNNFDLFDWSCYTKLDGNRLYVLKRRFGAERHEDLMQQAIALQQQLVQHILAAQQQQEGGVPIAQPQNAQPQIARPQNAQPQIAQPQIAQPQVVRPQIARPEIVWRYCEIDLDILLEDTYDVQMVFANTGEEVFGAERGIVDHIYEWVGNRLYTVCSSVRAQQKIIAFDTDIRLWLDLDILFLDSIENLYVDSDQHLLVKTLGPDSKKVFYRFALKKPDKLRNIAFLAMSRKFKWDAPKTYKKMVKYIPLNNPLQCQVPVKNVNDQEEVSH